MAQFSGKKMLFPDFANFANNFFGAESTLAEWLLKNPG